jgi:hypothetical protein
MDSIWQEGYEAYLCKKNKDDNPYFGNPDTEEKFHMWEFGFECADTDAEDC